MSTTPKNKLIRDKVVDGIFSESRTPNTKILNEGEFETEIFNKLLDESKEVIEAKNDLNHLPEEIADVLEVIDSIIKLKQLDISQIKQIQTDKRNQWGGFDNKIWLESVTEKE